MKMSIPFFVFETQLTINWVLATVFRSNPENKTNLRGNFVPRNIETKKSTPIEGGDFASRINMWADGIYLTALSEGFSDNKNGHDYYRTIFVHVRAKRYGAWRKPGDKWTEFNVPLWDILQAEKNAQEGIKEDSPQQVEARKRQELAIKAIHEKLRA